MPPGRSIDELFPVDPNPQPLAAARSNRRSIDELFPVTPATPAPAAAPRPSFGQIAQERMGSAVEAIPPMMRGVASGAVGAPGDLEEFAVYTAPRALGLRVPDQASFTGGRTLFPTTAEVARMGQGRSTTGPAARYESVGETIGGLLPYGGPAGRALRETGDVLQATVAPSSRVSRVARPTTVSEVGTNIETNIMENLNKLTEGRRAEYQPIFSRFMREGEQQADNIVRNYVDEIEALKQTYSDRMSPQIQSMFDRSIAELTTGRTGRPGIEAIDLERRRLAEMAASLPQQGVGAAERQFANALRDQLTTIIDELVPSSKQARALYQELSAPINRYATRLGQAVTQRAGEFLPDIPRADVADLPGRFFRSRSSINELRDLTGNEQLVLDLARRHVGNEIEGMRSAKELRDYLRTNRDWLNEVPELKGQLERAASNLATGGGLRALTALGFTGGAGAGLYRFMFGGSGNR